MSTGKRYTLAEKRKILRHLQDHTYEETSKEFGVSQMTLARWSKRIMLDNPNDETFGEPNTSGGANQASERMKFIESLLQVLKFNEEVKYVALISDAGQLITSVGTEEVSDDKLVANTAAILAVHDRTAREFRQGMLNLVYTVASNGGMLIAGAGPHACVVMLLDNGVNLVQFFPIIDKIRNALKNFV